MQVVNTLFQRGGNPVSPTVWIPVLAQLDLVVLLLSYRGHKNSSSFRSRIPLMSRPTISRPGRDEYSAYHETYISKVPNQNLLQLLEEQVEETCALLSRVSESEADAAYAVGKWTIKEVTGHLVDTERIMAYRLLRVARGDSTPLPGFEQDDYVKGANFRSRTLRSLIEEFRLARASTLALLQNLDEAVLTRRGVADGKPVSVRALAYIIAGHERHHVGILQRQYQLSP